MDGVRRSGRPLRRPRAGGHESDHWRQGAGNPAIRPSQRAGSPVRLAGQSARPTFVAAREGCDVHASDLDDLGKIHELLRVLNDPVAARRNVATLVGSIPVLSARCVRRASGPNPQDDEMTLDRALVLMGNRGLESELLQLLEDLTILKADLEEAVG